MLNIYPLEYKDWNSIVTSFENWDIYYLKEYAQSLKLHGDGEPYLIHYYDNDMELCYVVMKNDIAKSKVFENLLEKSKYFDLETPYGYGGPLFLGRINKQSLNKYKNELKERCLEENIVTQFYRFHPLIENFKEFEEENITKVIHNRHTIYIDTSSEDIIVQNMDSKNRNMVRKARKNNIIIQHDKGENIEQFISIYNSTMDAHEAQDYYYFDKDYFKYLIDNIHDNIIIFYAHYNEKIISAAIFFYNNRYMHYHLSGTLKDYRKLASTNLLLFEAANWASHHNIEKLHLGGGICANDSLFGFKKQFNKNGWAEFCIGADIFSEEKNNMLISIRKENEEKFCINNNFLIKYRA